MDLEFQMWWRFSRFFEWTSVLFFHRKNDPPSLITNILLHSLIENHFDIEDKMVCKYYEKMVELKAYSILMMRRPITITLL